MPVFPSKYEPLTRHLAAQSGESVRMKFSEIERVIGAKLPPSARAHRSYWSNNAENNVMTRAWLAAGFRSADVDLAGGKLTFRRGTPSGFSEAPAPPFREEEEMTPKPSPFGCMAGTVVVLTDLTEPADPELADYLDKAYGPIA
jgi:hypothetical protein